MTPKRSSTRDGYTYRWQQASKRFLQKNPLCAHHLQRGEIVAAQCVDHIEPHRMNQVLFWNESNWQPLCASCHSIKTLTQDRGLPLPTAPKPKPKARRLPMLRASMKLLR